MQTTSSLNDDTQNCNFNKDKFTHFFEVKIHCFSSEEEREQFFI